MRTLSFWLIAGVLLSFTRLDGHKVWFNSDQIVSVQGASQIGYKTGTLITTSAGGNVVQENVNQVVRKLRDQPITVPNPPTGGPAYCLCK